MALEIPLIHDSGVTQRLAAGDTAHFPDDVQIDGDLTVTGVVATGSIVGRTINSLRTVTNDNAGSIVIGTPVYLTAADTVDKALADDDATSDVIGLVYDTSIAASATGDIITSGTLEAATGEWDVVTGDSGGLVPGNRYWLDPDTAGMLTNVEPALNGDYVEPVGIALTTTELWLNIDTPIQTAVKVRALIADEDIYVDTAGNDTTGDGSVGSPYLTIHRAAEHYSKIVPGEHLIIVHVNLGVHTTAQSFTAVYPYGSNLRWNGVSETKATPTISNIDTAATTGSSPYTGLEFIDFDLDVSGTNAAVGHFVRLTGCTGGTNPQALNGLHEIIALSSGTATCRVWRRLNTTEIPSGSITVASAIIIESVLHFTADDHGINVAGPFEMGHWDSIVLKGNDTAVGSSKRGLRLFNGASIRSAAITGLTTGLFIYQWNTGAEIVGNAIAYLQRGGIAKMTSGGISSDSRGQVLFRNSSTINGVNGNAIFAIRLSDVLADTVIIHSVNTAAAALRQSRIDVVNSSISFDQGAGTALFADDLSQILETGSTITGYATDYSPAADTFGNNQSFIATL